MTIVSEAEFDIAKYLRMQGWVVPAYTMAPKAQGLKMLRIVLREDWSRERCSLFLRDIKLSVEQLEARSKEQVDTLREAQDATKRHHRQHDHEEASRVYKKSNHHNLHKYGKTHGVC